METQVLRKCTAVLLMLLLALGYSCSNDEEMPVVTEPPTGQGFSVATARSIYEYYIGSTSRLKSQAEDVVEVTPDWGYGVLINDTNWAIVETPLVFEDDRMMKMTTESVGEAYAESENPYAGMQDMRLIVMQHKETGQTFAFTMFILPDAEYLQRKGAEISRNNSYIKRDNDLSGLVLFYTVEGNFVNGWKYKEGKIAGYLKGGTGDGETPPFQAKSSPSKVWNCVDIVVYEYYPELGEWVKGYGVECWEVSMEIPSCNHIVNSNDEEWGGGGITPKDDNIGMGGNGSGNKPNNQNIPSDSIINKITKKNSLNDKDKKKLDDLMKVMVSECGYDLMYSHLTSRGAKLNDIRLDPTIRQAGYNAGNNTLLFKTSADITRDNLNEEFIHFFQNNYYPGGISKYSGKAGHSNIEFEAKLILDILCNIKGLGCTWDGSTTENSYYYSKWIESITKEGTYLPNYYDLLMMDSSFGNKNYWDFLSDFKNNPNKPYNYPIDRSLQPQILQYLNQNKSKTKNKCFN